MRAGLVVPGRPADNLARQNFREVQTEIQKEGLLAGPIAPARPAECPRSEQKKERRRRKLVSELTKYWPDCTMIFSRLQIDQCTAFWSDCVRSVYRLRRSARRLQKKSDRPMSIRLHLPGQLIAIKKCGFDPDGRPSTGATTRDHLPG